MNKTQSPIKTSVLLLAAGTGSRFKAKIPKQFVKLLGKPLILWSLLPIEKLVKNKKIQLTELVIVCDAKYRSKIGKIVAKKTPALTPFLRFAQGGKIRQESVLNGLKQATGTNLLLHETARPCKLYPFFLQLLNNPNPNVTLAEDIPFTVLKKDPQTALLNEILVRNELFNVQLPQKFDLASLLAAHEKAASENREFTDDSSLLFAYGGTVTTEKGSPDNIKVTHPQDLAIAKRIIKK